MIEGLAGQLRPLLDLPYIRKTRRNHGLEHATITLLSKRVPALSMAGRSNARGFVLVGEVATPQLEWAAHEALCRMGRGEHELAVHPNCGTNLVTTAFMVSVAAMLGLAGASRRNAWDRLTAAFMLVLITLLFAPAVGETLQRHITTEGDPGATAIDSITRREVALPGGRVLVMHHVRTSGG